MGCPCGGHENQAHPIKSSVKGRDSEASDAIIRIVDRPDPRPVWICVWGGSCEVAQAIWKVRATRSPEEAAIVLGKLRLYLIAKQDATTDWLLESFPSLFIILSEKNYMGLFWVSSGADKNVADLAWVNAHIREGHGPLGAAYPKSGWDPSVPGIWEGDTPSFLYLVSAAHGLNDPEKPGRQAGEVVSFATTGPKIIGLMIQPAGNRLEVARRCSGGLRSPRGLDATVSETPHEREAMEIANTSSRPRKSLERTRAGHVSCQCGRAGPPASLSSVGSAALAQ